MWKTEDDKHHRRSVRLQGYDYSQPGAYFVTLCVQDKQPLLGEIADGVIRLNDVGNFVQIFWQQLSTRYPTILLDAFVVMPDHVHGIISMHADKSVDGPAEVMESSVGAIHESPFPTDSDGQRRVQQRRGDPEMKFENGEFAEGTELSGRAIRESPLQKPVSEHSNVADDPWNRRSMLLSKIVGYFKMNTGKYINCLRNTPGGTVWQRNYYEHIIRDENALAAIRHYITMNPSQWECDLDTESMETILSRFKCQQQKAG